MKERKKFWLIIGCVVALLAVSVVGTLAYLMDTASTVNTFSIGKVDIRLDEAVVDVNGKPQGDERTTEGNEYHLVPGQTYTKDPTITVVKGSSESYVRMLVTINEISGLEAIYGEDSLPGAFMNGWNEAIWPCVSSTDNGDNSTTYEFRYYKTVVVSEDADITLEPLFEGFTLSGDDVSSEELNEISELEINVIGNAIQKTGFDNENEAWKAFDDESKK